jgi:Zn-dependent peptidase ImmA (M78 family)
MSSKFNGKQLEKAIILSGKSKKDISSLLEIPSTSLSKYIQGTTSPPEKTVSKMIELLGLNAEWFSLQDLSCLEEEAFAYRKKISTSRSENLKNETIKEILKRGTQYLLQFLKKSPDLKLVYSADLELLRKQKNISEIWNEIEKLTIELRTLWGLGNSPIPDLANYAEANGIWCTRINASENDKVDAFSFWATVKRENGELFQKDPVILLTNAKSAVRSRFDLAHEIGHLVLHRMIDWRLYMADSQYRKQIEQEADYFASCFLLPTETFTNSVKGGLTLTKLQSLKSIWKVSMACMIKRAGYLNLIENEDYLFMRMSQFGMRRSEPFDTGENAFTHEPVQLYRLVSEHLEKEGHLNLQAIQEYLGLDLDLFCHYFSVPRNVFIKHNDFNNIIQLFN